MGAWQREGQRRPWIPDQGGSAVKSVDSAASLPGLELIPSLPICVTLGKSLPCPVPLSDQLNTGILIALTI